MATRFYFNPGSAPDVSPAYSGVWDDTGSSQRSQITLDTPANTGNYYKAGSESSASAHYECMFQGVSGPLDSISATLPVVKGAFRCVESAAKADAKLVLVVRKCDQDGSNPTDICILTDDTEFEDGAYNEAVNRFLSAGDQANQSFSQGDRLILEIGAVFNNTKTDAYTSWIYATNNHATTDLPENDTETTAYNAWFETGDTFTEASGEPAAIKLGPMFAFA